MRISAIFPCGLTLSLLLFFMSGSPIAAQSQYTIVFYERTKGAMEPEAISGGFYNQKMKLSRRLDLDEESGDHCVIGHNSILNIRLEKSGQPGFALHEFIERIEYYAENAKGDSILERTAAHPDVYDPASSTRDPDHPLARKSYDINLRGNPGLKIEPGGSLDGVILTLLIETKKKTIVQKFRMKHYKIRVLVNVNSNSPISTDSLEGIVSSLAGSQVNVSYLWREDEDDSGAFTIIHVPVVRWESREWLLNNLEIGLAIPVNSDLSREGLGGSIGFLRASEEGKTIVQFGIGGRKRTEENENRTERFWFIGLDIPSGIRFLSDLSE